MLTLAEHQCLYLAHDSNPYRDTEGQCYDTGGRFFPTGKDRKVELADDTSSSQIAPGAKSGKVGIADDCTMLNVIEKV